MRRSSPAGSKIRVYQHFTGETFFQHRAPIDPSSLTRWRKRIGEEGVEWLLTQTIQAGQKAGAIDENSVKRVAIDTTVMEKNIAYPTDARLYERARAQIVALAQQAGVELRQSYARLAPRLALQVGRSAHAKQFKRMRKALKKLKVKISQLQQYQSLTRLAVEVGCPRRSGPSHHLSSGVDDPCQRPIKLAGGGCSRVRP
jgi:hypothetical protein